MTNPFDIPLTSGDLRAIADNLDEWEKVLISEEADREYTPLASLINYIDVFRPDAPDELIGRFELIDGWIGFVPLEGSK